MRFLPELGGNQRYCPPPAASHRFLIPLAKVSYCEGDGYTILTQEINHNGFRIWQHRILVTVPTLIHPVVEEDLIILHYTLAGHAKCPLTDKRSLQIKQGRYQLYGLRAGTPYDAWFDPGEVISFHIGLPEKTQDQIGLQYPFFADLLKKMKQGRSEVLAIPIFRITKKITLAIEEIISCREEKFKRELFLRERISFLLQVYMTDMDIYERVHQAGDSRQFNLNDLEKFIEANLRSPDLLTLEELASHCQMNPNQFHNLFLLRFTGSLNELLLQIRMKKAIYLLREDKLSILEIAMETGYSDKGNFSRAFKKYYGKSPSSFLNP